MYSASPHEAYASAFKCLFRNTLGGGAELNGREEVGSDPTQRLAGDPDGKGEAYVFGIDGDPTTLCHVLTVEKIQLVPVSEVMAAHIHEGARDGNGPFIAALAGPEDANAADCLTEGEMGKTRFMIRPPLLDSSNSI